MGKKNFAISMFSISRKQYDNGNERSEKKLFNLTLFRPSIHQSYKHFSFEKKGFKTAHTHTHTAHHLGVETNKKEMK